jgi:hypothetical protein
MRIRVWVDALMSQTGNQSGKAEENYEELKRRLEVLTRWAARVGAFKGYGDLLKGIYGNITSTAKAPG